MGWQKLDFDADGSEELLVDSDLFSVYLSPGEGGSIFEWDLRRHNYNVLSTLARRLEAYHKVLTEPSSEEQIGERSVISSIHDLIRVKGEVSLGNLIYDKYLRYSLIDHFFVTGTKLEEFANQSYVELGDFVAQPYDFSVEQQGGKLTILLRRRGVLQVRSKNLPFEVQKEIKLVAGEEKVDIRYQLKNVSDSSVQAVFGSEWNINLLGGGHNEQAYYRVPGIALDDHHLDSWGELTDVESLVMGNRQLGIELELTARPKIRLWRFPVESISNSEGGIERTYQQSCLLALLSLDLLPGGVDDFNLVWLVKSPII